MLANDRIEAFMPGKRAVLLSAADHVASGGEGAVYVKDGVAFKLYLDPGKARAAGMAEKVHLLSRVRHRWIVSPVDVLLDRRGDLIGHYMPVADGVPLVKLFTNSFRDAHRFGDDDARRLVENMRTTVQTAHDGQALIVDGNEMNWRVAGVEPRLLDVDSWQIGRFPATALMPAVRDYHAARPSELSDWFTWGIVSFETLVGIHPYKGTHPDFRKGDLQSRMIANASVFDPRVRLAAATRDFGVIPAALRAWYERVFQGGERSSPPSVLASATAPFQRKARTVQFASGALKHEKVLSVPGRILHVFEAGIAIHEAATGGALFDLIAREPIVDSSTDLIEALLRGRAAILRSAAGLVCLELDPNGVRARRVSNKRSAAGDIEALLPLTAERILVWGGRPFALCPTQDSPLVELAVSFMQDRPILAHKRSWPGRARAMTFGTGAAILDALGTPFLVIPEGEAVHFNRCDALHGYRVLGGLAKGPRGALVAAARQSDGERCLVHLGLQGERYVVLHEATLEQADLNAAVNDAGIAVALIEDGTLDVFRLGSPNRASIHDAALASDMRLFALPSGIHYSIDRSVYRLSFS